MDPKIKQMLDCAWKEKCSAAEDIHRLSAERKKAEKEKAKAQRRVNSAKKHVRKVTKEAIRDRGAQWVDAHGNAHERTFTAAPPKGDHVIGRVVGGAAADAVDAAEEEIELQLTYDAQVKMASREVDELRKQARAKAKALKVAEELLVRGRDRKKIAAKNWDWTQQHADRVMRELMQGAEMDEQKTADFGAALTSKLEQLTECDLSRLKLVFLDKSGSMGCNSNTYDALCLGVCNSLAPAEGCCLLFLLAGPGETQVFFSRAGEASRPSLKIQLGCSTWFNEPVFMVLRALAPIVEAMRSVSSSSGSPMLSNLDPEGGSCDASRPPFEVVCITDGMDNCSSNMFASLPNLAKAVAGIKGPETETELYLPLGTWQSTDKAAAKEAIAQGMVPVFIVWVALGNGSGSLLEQADPGRIAVVDATFPFNAAPAFVSKAAAGPTAAEPVAVGSCVIIDDDRKGVVTALHGTSHLEVLFTADMASERVAVERLKANEQDEEEEEDTAEAGGDAACALALADAAITRTHELMAYVSPKTGIVKQSAGRDFLEGKEADFAAQFSVASKQMEVAKVPESALPEQFVQNLLVSIGAGLDEQEGGVAQDKATRYLLKRSLKAVLCERDWDKVPLQNSLELASKTAGFNTLCMPERLLNLSGALAGLMTHLVEMGAVAETPLALGGATPIELRPGWDRSGGVQRVGYEMVLEGRPAIVCALAMVTELGGEELVGLARQAYAARLVRLAEEARACATSPGSSSSSFGSSSDGSEEEEEA